MVKILCKKSCVLPLLLLSYFFINIGSQGTQLYRELGKNQWANAIEKLEKNGESEVTKGPFQDGNAMFKV